MTKISKYLKEKGQGLTEYVLILAFIAGVAMAIFGNGGLKTTLANTLDRAVNMIASITGKSYDIPPAIDQITALINKKPKVFNGTKIGTTDGNAAGNQNSDRGFIRNQWLKDEHLEAYPEIAGLLNGLDADSWVYYTNTNYGAGLYWTTEDLQSLTFSKGNKDASSEYLLSYYYDPNAADGKNFKVIQNRVWTGQKDMAPVGSQTSAAQATNMTALAGLNKEHEKSEGQVVWSGTSYAEAQKETMKKSL